MIGVMTFCGMGLTASSAMAIDGPLANATVSFGQWKTDREPPLDRYPNNSPAGANNHELIPNVVKIKEGGSVNFIISGLHLPAIYEDTQPELIDRNTLILTHPSTGVAIPAGGVINDVNNRVYRGLDPQFLIPSTNPQQVPRERDRVEVVQFTKPGTYLVICALRNHFFNPTSQEFEMFGFVKVLPGKGK
jgi:hypothetical protein